MSDPDRAVVLDAVDALNDIVGDLVAGTRVLLDYHEGHRAGHVPNEQMVAVQKMCLSHLVLGLSKLDEFWERYHEIVPADYRAQVKSLNRELKAKKVGELRNAVVAHIWDRKLGRARRLSEVMGQLELLTSGHLGEFLRWLNNPSANSYPNTVLSVVEALRDTIMVQHDIDPSEVIDR